VGARNRAENCNQDDEDGAGRDGVAEQGQRIVIGQGIGHDARADDRSDKERGAERFRR
jgi:hypothetical protein